MSHVLLWSYDDLSLNRYTRNIFGVHLVQVASCPQVCAERLPAHPQERKVLQASWAVSDPNFFTSDISKVWGEHPLAGFGESLLKLPGVFLGENAPEIPGDPDLCV